MLAYENRLESFCYPVSTWFQRDSPKNVNSVTLYLLALMLFQTCMTSEHKRRMLVTIDLHCMDKKNAETFFRNNFFNFPLKKGLEQHQLKRWQNFSVLGELSLLR